MIVSWKYCLFIWPVLVLGPISGFSQNEISGRIQNGIDKKSIPFVNVLIATDHLTGTVSNIEGNYRLKIPAGVENTDSVRFSCIGFHTIYKSIGSLRQNPDIDLTPQSENLNEVVVTATEDPAYALMRKVVSHRDQNRPESLPHFKFTSYNKANIDVARNDSLQAGLDNTGFKDAHFFMLESATDVVYQKPEKWNETVLRKKISGINNPTMSLLSNSFQPFSCYDDYLNIAGFDNLNPISPNSDARYNFTLRDTVQIEGDTVYVIHFTPRKNVAEELMEGSLSISAKTFALVNFRASSTGNYKLVMFEVRQAYAKIDSIWFPKESNTTYRIIDQKSEVEIVCSSSTFNRDISLSYIPTRGDFGIARVNTSATDLMPASTGLTMRSGLLTRQEENTYAVYDTLPKNVLGPMNWMMNQSEALASGRLNFGMVDILLDKLFGFNPYEGFRLGAGLATSSKLIRWMSAESYVAYGFNDKQMKYGGGLRFFIQPSSELELGLFYRNDVKEPGYPTYSKDLGYLKGSKTIHNLYIRRMNPVEQYETSLTLRPVRGLRTKAAFIREELTIQPHDYFFDAASSPVALVSSIAKLEIRYTPGESLLRSNNTFIPLSLSYPRLTLSLSHAMPDVFESTTAFTQVNIQIEHELKIRGTGTTRLFGFAAKTWGGSTPYPYLFFGRGGHGESDFGLLSIGYFQTMGLYDYLSDEFIQGGFIHNFGSIFGIKKSYSKPELKLAYQAAIGNLSKPNTTDIPFAYAKMDRAYLEGGLIIDNILRVSSSFYYSGFGIGAFYKQGYYSEPNFSDNLSLILSFAISL